MKLKVLEVKGLLLASIVLLACFLVVRVQAESVVQGFNADETINAGMIVGLVADSPGKVVAISTIDIDSIHGVAVNPSDSPLILGSEDSDVYIAKDGRFDVLVSNSNGPIKAGDFISTSSTPGIGQKATEDQTLVLGRALQDFVPGDGSEVLSQLIVESKPVSIGRILADIGVSRNPTEKQKEQDAPDFLNRATELIADKPVSPVRQYISLVILLLVAAIAGSLIYASVRSSITAIGRNPLSRSSILRSLLQVVVIALVVLFSGLFAVYLILRF